MNLAHGRWLGDFENLSEPEKRLVDCCARGKPWMPEAWDGKRPEAASDANTIRADLIRFLALGGDALHPVHEAGVMAWGGWITGELILHQCRAPVRLDLKHCWFVGEPCFMAAHFPELALSGSRVPGLSSDRIKVTGNLYLDDGFTAEGEVRLLGAEIGGDLYCDDGSFVHEGRKALNADGIEVGGGLFLRKGAFRGSIKLAAAQIGTLVDDAACWVSGEHDLDGFHYDRIVDSTDAASRIRWLKSQRTDFLEASNWRPQPWEQLIRVLREMGHPGAATEVAIEKQRMMRKAGQIGGRQPRPQLIERWKWLELGWIALVNLMMRFWHHVYEVLAGFGYRPGRILIWMIAVWGFGGYYFNYAASTGLMAPSNTEVIMHRQLHGDIGGADIHAGTCGLRHEVEPASYWPACAALPSEYTTFNPWLYSADLILPLVDLQQDSEWAPAASFVDAKGIVHDLAEGQFARALLWFEILFGWFASLMFVAIVSRLVEKD